MSAAATICGGGASRAALLAVAAGLCACKGASPEHGAGTNATSVRGKGSAEVSPEVEALRGGDEAWVPGAGNLGTTSEIPSSEASNGANGARGVGGLGPPIAMPAAVSPDVELVRGSLEREIIRRIVWRQMPALLACYEPALARRPRIAGRLTLTYAIAPSGNVRTSAVRRSTVRDASVGRCFVEEIRRWQFPRPLDGREVFVTHSFTLTAPRAAGRR